MKDNEHFQIVGLGEYESWSTDDRRRYLDLYVGSSTDLSEDFCLAALKWETSPLAKWYLIRALGLLKSEGGINTLIQICNEADVDFGNTSLHLICAWSLGHIGEPTVPFLLQALNSAKEADARKCLVDALGETRSQKAIPALENVFRKDGSAIKLWAALSLSKIGKPALDTLYLLLSEATHWRDRVYLIDAICKIKDSGSNNIIRNILYNGTKEEKHFVLERCVDCFDESFREPLELISVSESADLSLLAKRALAAQ